MSVLMSALAVTLYMFGIVHCNCKKIDVLVYASYKRFLKDIFHESIARKVFNISCFCVKKKKILYAQIMSRDVS